MQTVMTTLSVQNPCNLSSIIRTAGTHGDSLKLTGQYYAANAPLCCPTKQQATTLLHFNNGNWAEQPQYFKFLK
jgi:hypothetical protein